MRNDMRIPDIEGASGNCSPRETGQFDPVWTLKHNAVLNPNYGESVMSFLSPTDDGGDLCWDDVPDKRDAAFAAEVAAIVARHAPLALSIKPHGSHFAKKSVAHCPMDGEFRLTWVRYNDAMFNTLRRMVRFERSAEAWVAVLRDVDDAKLRDTIVVDYVEPVFRMLFDLPGAFKEQAIKGSVKLAIFSRVEDPFDRIAGITQGHWYSQFQEYVMSDSRARELSMLVNGPLYDSASARRLRRLHGEAVHDVSPGLVDGSPFVERMREGVVAFGIQPPYDLEEELEPVVEQRLVAREAYDAFDLFARRLCGDR